MANGASPTLLSEATGPPLDIPVPILQDLVRASVAAHADKVALICKHQAADLFPAVFAYGGAASKSSSHLIWTHKQLQHSADLLAHALAERGVQPGSTIAVLLSGRAEFHTILRAAVKLKCPFTPINVRSAQHAKEIRHMFTLSEAKVVIVEDAAIAQSLEEHVPDLMSAMQLKAMTGDKSTFESYLSLGDLVSSAAMDNTFESQSQALDSMPRDLEDVVFNWFTSGTTSLPKAAPHTNKSLTANIRSWGDSFKLDDTRAWLHVLPMNSIVGSSWTTAYLIPGGSITHCNFNFDVPSIAQSIYTGEFTDVLLVPSMIDLLAASPVLDSEKNQGIEHVIVGGSKILHSHVAKSFKSLKCSRFSPFFGMTEGTSLCTETLYEIPADTQAPIYSGYTCPGAKARICAQEGTEPVPRGEPGELVQGGLQRIERYLGGQGKDNFFTDSGEIWFRTGDMAVMTKDCRIDIVGRYKDMIIRGGMNIASAAVEAVIGESTGIDAQVIGIPDEVAGEVPLAVVKVPKSDKSPLTDVQKCVLTRLGRSYALERVLRLDDLGLEDWPKTTSGKVLKRELQRMTLELIKRETEQMSNGNGHVGKQRTERIRLTERELQEYLLDRVKASGILVDTIDDDFHNAGMDSLLAMQLRNAIVKNISDGIDVPMNIIFEAGNVRDLAARLKAEDSPHDEPVTNVDSMAAMVDRYSNFRAHKAPATRKRKRGVSNNVPETHTILLTGATGSLGAHVLAQLIKRSDVKAIYCPVRGDNPTQRLENALSERSLLEPEYGAKVKMVAFDVAKPGFGLDGTTLETLRNHLTLVIHAAWPVNFQLSLASFEPHIVGLQSLIQLCLDVKSRQPAKMFFCSSMGVALGTQGQRRIIEEPIMDLRQASASGYTQSKLVCEYIVQRAVEDFGAIACNLRIGQIVGDMNLGIWNETEAPPLMVRSALSLGTLPALDITCSWIPVDTIASGIIELAMPSAESEQRLVYNLCNPKSFSWTDNFLPALAKAGLQFSVVPFDKWLSQLKSYNSSHSTQTAIDNCPAVKLIDFYETTYTKIQPNSTLQFDTRAVEKDSPSIRDSPDVIKSGLVKTMLSAWMAKWSLNS